MHRVSQAAALSSVLAAFLAGGLPGRSRAADRGDATVAAYYFPNYHLGDPRNEARQGKGWSEWELVKAARPRFPGHVQPNVPAWGYADESDPEVMARKIDAAADHGVDAFIFDWYWYDDGPFLERGLDRGFLGARNNRRLRFALMWANHDWIDIHPRTLERDPPLLYPGRILPATFERMTDVIVSRYFSHPSHLKIEGRPYFSVYDLTALVGSFGSLEATRKALDGFRAKTRAAGFPDAHLNAVVWGNTILPGESTAADPAGVVKALGFDSVTSYVWIHHVALPTFPATDYVVVRDGYLAYRDRAETLYGVPYWPNVTMGWDSSPRADQDEAFVDAGYPFMATISGNTPERFRESLEIEKARLEARPAGRRIVTINCWNEWTEGSYLEPDTRSGMRYLEAVRAVFGRTPRISIEGGKWRFDGTVTYPGTRAEGLLMNVRMVNAVFEDAKRPDFDPRANTEAFVERIPDYAAHGVRAFTICLQGGMPGYEGAVNSAFAAGGSLRPAYLERVRRVIEACDASGVAVILGCFYQRQDQILRDAEAVRVGVRNVARWIREAGFGNVLLEIANEFGHDGFDHEVLRNPAGQAELIRLARSEYPELLVSTSGLGHGQLADEACEASDFVLVHYNGVPVEEIPKRVAALRRWGKPIVCNEDDKPGAAGARAAELSVESGASWGCMLTDVNQYFPLRFQGAADDPTIYAKLKELTSR